MKIKQMQSGFVYQVRGEPNKKSKAAYRPGDLLRREAMYVANIITCERFTEFYANGLKTEVDLYIPDIEEKIKFRKDEIKALRKIIKEHKDGLK